MLKRRSRRRGSRRTASARRLVPRLVALVPEFAVSGSEQLGWALGVLREQVGEPREVAARLVAAHGPSIRHGLREYRNALPEIEACFARSPVKAHAVLDAARALIRQLGVRQAGAELARRYGLGVFDALNQHAKQPEIHALLGLPPAREAHRPMGSTSRDLEAYALAELCDGLGVRRAPLLRALRRDPERRGPERSDTADVKWFRRRLRRGREFRRCAARRSASPDAAMLTFLHGYLRGLGPRARLGQLSPLLVDAFLNAQPDLRRGWRFDTPLIDGNPQNAANVGEALASAQTSTPTTATRRVRRPVTARQALRAPALRAILAEHLRESLTRILPPHRG